MTSKHSLRLTQQAQVALTRLASKTPLREPIFTVARGETGGNVVWGVAAYERKTLGDATTISIDGFDFYIDPSVEADLQNKILDYKDGKFSLR
jgi:hypothetical protein